MKAVDKCSSIGRNRKKIIMTVTTTLIISKLENVFMKHYAPNW